MMTTDSKPVEILARNIGQRLDELGMTARDASLNATGKEDAIREIRRGKMPATDRLSKLAEVLDVSVDWLLGKTDRIVSEVRMADVRMPYHAGMRQDRSLPIWGTARGHDLRFNGQTILIEPTMLDPADTIGYALRPEKLAGVDTAYAVYIQGESMMPRWEPGDLAIVDPRKPPKNGDDVIVQLVGDHDEDGESRVICVLIKRLVRRTATHYELLQYYPEEVTFRVEKSRVAAIHRIVREGALFDS